MMNGDLVIENNNNAARNAGKGNTGESIPVVQRPSIKGALVCTSRRNAPSSSAQSINFPELVQFMMMQGDVENQMEQGLFEEKEMM